MDDKTKPGGSAAITLTMLRDEALKTAREHGFTDATVGEDFMLMVSEIAEALEDHRAGDAPAAVWYCDKGASEREQTAFDPAVPSRPMRKPCGIPSEMADVIIRVLHFCGKHSIDIEKAVLEKMAYNNSRPFKHGKTL